MPIRWRLTLWFALILSAILILSSVALHILLQEYLISHIDGHLRVYSAQVHGTLNTQEIPEPLDYAVIHSKLPPINEFASPGIYIQLVDSSGGVVVKSNNLGEQELPVNPYIISQGFAGNAIIETVAAGDGASIRVMVSPLYMRDQVLLLEVAQSLNHVASTMSQVRWALLASTLVALVLATVSAGAIIKGALSPVSKISRTAKSIEASSDLSQRVGYSGPRDEIGELATTFDHMIEHLDRVFQSQRYFVADASHELRGPLTVIRGNLDLLKRKLDEKERQESLNAMERESIRMSKIADDLLLLAETESGQLKQKRKVSLKEIVLGELERAKSLAIERKIIVDHKENLVVRGDAQRLRQLLANLVDNAIKYTPDHGTITLSLFKDDSWARMEVTDTGIGIAPDHLPYIFDRFYRVDKVRSRTSSGTGLGLAIVKGIAEQHGGKVTVTSRPGKGSTFTVWLKL